MSSSILFSIQSSQCMIACREIKARKEPSYRDSVRCGLPISWWAIDLLIWRSRKLNPRRTLPDSKKIFTWHMFHSREHYQVFALSPMVINHIIVMVVNMA